MSGRRKSTAGSFYFSVQTLTPLRRQSILGLEQTERSTTTLTTRERSSTILYVQKEAENVHPGEEHLINEAGVTIGTIDSIALDFDSLYMDFPIKEVKDPNMPLWWLELNQWDDPTQDPFNEDYVCLYLNSHYSFCPKVGDTIKNVDILVEIVSTAYLMIIKKIEEMGYLVPTLDGNNLEVGSISQAMYYFYTSCDPALKPESIDLLQKTIRINIERMLKGGQSE